jgi:hypothetical protein
MLAKMETNQERMEAKMDTNLKIIAEMRAWWKGISRKDGGQDRDRQGTNGSRN